MKDFLPSLQKTTLTFLKKNIAVVYLSLFCLVLTQLCVGLGLVYAVLEKQTAILTIRPSDEIQSITPYPQFITSYLPDITAEAGYIVEKESKVPLFAKNENIPFPIASTTKIMTALVALETYQLSDILTVKRENVEGAVMGLKKDEKLTFESLLYGMMLPSGNDAAFVIADNYPGGVKSFVTRMNSKARELFLFETEYIDPTGLEEGDLSTARDLARIAEAAITHPILRDVVKTRERVVSTIDEVHIFSLKNLNILLGEMGVIGLKTGYTLEAGGVLVTVKEEKGREIIVVVMRSNDRFYDTRLLLSLIHNNLQFFAPQIEQTIL